MKKAGFCSRFAAIQSKLNTKGEAPIVLKLNDGKTRKQVGLGFFIKPSDWSNEHQRAIKGKQASIINNKIESIEAIINNVVLNNGSIRDIIIELDKPNLVLKDYINKVADSLKDNGDIGNSKVYRSLARKVTQDILLKDVDKDVFNSFRSSLKGLSENSITHYCKTFKAVINRAFNDGYLKSNPLACIRLSSALKTKRNAYLRPNELNKLKLVDNLPKKFDKARKIFLFQYYCIGISFADAVELTTENIKGNKIVYKRIKTNVVVEVPMNTELKILLQWFRDYTKLTDDRLLPVMRQPKSNTIEYNIYRNNKLLIYNSKLKQIAQILDIPNLTSYYSRHTVAMQLRNNGVNIEVISQILGHSNVAVTQSYLADFEDDVVLDAMKFL